MVSHLIAYDRLRRHPDMWEAFWYCFGMAAFISFHCILCILMPPQLDVDSSVVSLLFVFLLLLPSLQETNSFVDSLWEAIMKTARKKAGRTITKSRNMESRFSRCIECVVLVCQTRLSTFTIQLGRSLSFMMFFMWVYLYIIVYIVYTYVT